jgi:predicted ATPase
MENDLPKLISTIIRIKSNNQIKKYIDFIQFPFYRNIDLDTRINFNFPLTVFIGQNGCGKSSCLHALYGAPVNYTPYEFWFDTKIDPITYYNDQRKRHSFWYSFRDTDSTIKEVIKARIKRGDDPNYWETSRPLSWAGMKKISGRNDRDKPINKKVTYIDFRAELSAFDKFFYFGNVKGIKSKNKQEYIQKKSYFLKKVLMGEVDTYHTKSGVTNKKLRAFNEIELNWISFILGKSYISGKFIEHSFFRNNGYSVIFKTTHAEYSEAFAGSGEVAVVRLVLKVLDAADYSLILLDEPEVSLHPGAQLRLKLFLLNQIKLKKHQVIITSHSPSIIKGLPKEAIKVFYQNPGNGRFLVKENLTPEEAFYHIEFPIEDRKNIIVEDILAQEIVQNVLNSMGHEVRNLFNVKFNPGGESVIKREFATIYCRELKSNNFIFFDGDQKPTKNHYNWRDFPISGLSVEFVQKKILEQTNEKISFSVDSGQEGGNQEQQLELLKQYLDYFLFNVFYLPSKTPEDIIWNREKARQHLLIIIPDETQVLSLMADIDSITSTKKKFAKLTKLIYSSDRSEDILSIHKLFLQYWIIEKNSDFRNIEFNITSLVS